MEIDFKDIGLRSGEGEVSDTHRKAAMAGRKLIRCAYGKESDATVCIIGFDVHETVHVSRPGIDAVSTASEVITGGAVYFYPASDRVLWGWILDTENNRRKLAAKLKTGEIVVADAGVRAEIVKLAERLGYPTQRVVHHEESYVRTEREQVLEDDLVASREEIIKLKQLLALKEERMRRTEKVATDELDALPDETLTQFVLTEGDIDKVDEPDLGAFAITEGTNAAPRGRGRPKA